MGEDPGGTFTGRDSSGGWNRICPGGCGYHRSSGKRTDHREKYRGRGAGTAAHRREGDPEGQI